MTAAAAVAGIREIDRTGTVGLIGAEQHPPYDRPPLSKALWKGDPLDSIWRNVDRQGVSSHLGRTALSLDARNRQVVDDHGMLYTYGKLLLATGCTPRRLPFGDQEIIYFRTVEDWQRVHAMAGHGKRIAIVGGGFIASELAASLAYNNQHVVMIFPDEGIGSRMYPPELAAFLNRVYRRVNRVYAAGDVANFYDPSLNEWRRVEHVGNATTMGGFVGVAMAGRTLVYDHTPFFYSDFFEFGYEAVGHVDSRLEMVTDWRVPCREGVIYYLRDSRVRGVLLWNIWGQVDAARRLIVAPGSHAISSLKGRLGQTR
jgi:NADPH-dependent 2,4-dienoyl-CoA reductase/sulfur reductase-like enzyme